MGVFPLMSQDFDVVPKHKTIEAGFAYAFRNGFEQVAPASYGAAVDVAWQVSGFRFKKAAYISIPFGYFYSPATTNDSLSAKRMFYGWTIRHELRKEKQLIPFISYGLLLNQLWISETKGHSMGHETRFDFGADWKVSDGLKITLRLSYSHATFPSFGTSDSESMDFLSLVAGLRF